MENYFLIRVLQWASGKQDGFSYSELISNFNFQDWEKTTIDGYFSIARENAYRRGMPNFSHNPETIFHLISGHPNEAYSSSNMKYVATSEALFNYLDFEELKFARENAKEAKRLSIIAICISGLAFLASVFIPQTIRVDESQLQLIRDSLGKLM